MFSKFVFGCLRPMYKSYFFGRVTPVMVFDGADLPSKKGTETNRKSSREEFKAKGLQALRYDHPTRLKPIQIYPD